MQTATSPYHVSSYDSIFVLDPYDTISGGQSQEYLESATQLHAGSRMPNSVFSAKKWWVGCKLLLHHIMYLAKIVSSYLIDPYDTISGGQSQEYLESATQLHAGSRMPNSVFSAKKWWVGC
jgi:hypothetical protein